MTQLAPPPLRTDIVKGQNATYPWQAWFNDIRLQTADLIDNRYVLKPATKTTLGGVIIGNNINIDDTGKISVDKGADYELPIASGAILGGVKIGTGITETSDGTISVDANIQNKDHDVLDNRQVLATSAELSRHDAIALWYDGEGISRYGASPYGVGQYKGYATPGMTVDEALDELFNRKPPAYILPEASKTTLGGIKLGDSLTTDPSGNVIVNPTEVIQPNSDHDLLSNRFTTATSHVDSRHIAQAIWYDGVGFGRYGQGVYGNGQYKGYQVSGMTVDDALDEIFSLSVFYDLPTASPTVKGGIKVGDDFTMNGETLQLRHAPTIASLTGGSVNEKGQTVSSVSLAWALSGDTPTHSTLTDVSGFDVNTAGGSHNFTGLSITTDKTYALTIGDDVENPSSTASAVVHFTQKMYYGNNAASSLTSAQVVALANKFLTDSRLQTLSLDGGGNYLYIAYPSAYGVADIWVGGLKDTSWIKTTVSVTNASGATENFYVYRSANQTSGAGISVEVK